MKHVVIAGGGVAGSSAAIALSRSRRHFRVTLIDKSKHSHFLPLLPDVLGRGINPGYLMCDLEKISRKNGIEFVHDRINFFNLEKKEVVTDSRVFPYDFLVIASGSETNFYGNAEIKKYAYALDDTHDASTIRDALEKKNFNMYLIVGGGYTGIEVATHVRIFLLKARRRDKRVVIVERAPSILGMLPQWIKEYVLTNLKELDIEVLTDTAVETVREGSVSLQGGALFDNVMFIWTAGVRTADFILSLQTEKSPQGRIKVDSFLRVRDDCFAVGDAAYVMAGDGFLRMAVQFAITQGKCAAANVVRSAWNQPLVRYQPVDLGYIIPMANNKSCGTILGTDLRGRLPTLLHYFMCTYRSRTLRNQAGVMRQLLKGG